MSWSPVPEAAAASEWDTTLLALDEPSLDQSHAWGQHAQRLGWRVRRLVARDAGGRVRAQAQWLYRSYGPNLRTLWCPGGPVGEVATWDEGLRQAVCRAVPGPGHYLRLHAHRGARPAEVQLLAAAGWSRVRTRARSGRTMRLALDRDPGALLAGLTGNWRHNLRRAGTRGLSVRRWESPDLDEILAAYRSMEHHKSLRGQFSRAQLASLFTGFGGCFRLFRCDDAAGRLLALRGCIVLGPYAWDMLAATTVAGRASYASYALFWTLLEDCRAAGVRDYDLRGVEPESSPGVYAFKKGTGAALVEQLGEWDWASAGWLRWAADLAVRHRRAGD